MISRKSFGSIGKALLRSELTFKSCVMSRTGADVDALPESGEDLSIEQQCEIRGIRSHDLNICSGGTHAQWLRQSFLYK